jgi:SAM-dependent methyltransferase
MSGITARRILLLGNGGSEKELAFLGLNPALLVYSDLSSTAVRALFERYDVAPYRQVLRGAAIDALSLPCHDASFDVVYGYAMVHHIADIPSFLREVHRVLKPGGQCVFLDDAFAPVWHYSKRTILRPLMMYSHRTTGISPEDYRFSMSGGFREKDLAAIIRQLGGEPWFERTGFLTYLWTRAVEKLLPAALRRTFAGPRLGSSMAALDRLLAPVLSSNFIRIAWGFHKPAFHA